jgi:hypothetical protein
MIIWIFLLNFLKIILKFKNIGYNVQKIFLCIFYSLDWFWILSHVLMMYYECYYISKSNNLNINLNMKNQILDIWCDSC